VSSDGVRIVCGDPIAGTICGEATVTGMSIAADAAGIDFMDAIQFRELLKQ
jgi:hypothetical protein